MIDSTTGERNAYLASELHAGKNGRLYLIPRVEIDESFAPCNLLTFRDLFVRLSDAEMPVVPDAGLSRLSDKINGKTYLTNSF